MTKVRFIFIGVVFIIAAAAVIFFNHFEPPTNMTIEKISEFKITQISRNGNVFYDKRPIAGRELSQVKRVDIKRMQFNDEIYFMTDNQTAFEFYCHGTAFTVLPGSYLYYQPKTKEFWFYQGAFLWNKIGKKQKVDIFLKQAENTTGDTSPRVVTLSQKGKLRINPNTVILWNHEGSLKYNEGDEPHNLKANQTLISTPRRGVNIHPLLHPPEHISPVETIIALNEPGDSVVKFNWKAVRGAQLYILRLYSSILMEHILLEKEIETNRLNVDMLQFEDFGEFYWQVTPYDPVTQREGIPSKLGFIKVTGTLLDKETALRPPELKQASLNVNGNLVVIQGETDKDAQLFINNVAVPVTEGKFIHTVNFQSIGRHKIIFKILSPVGVEIIVEKSVNIYDQ